MSLHNKPEHNTPPINCKPTPPPLLHGWQS